MKHLGMILVVGGALLLAGCGSGGNGGNGGSGDDGEIDTTATAYQGGVQLCTGATVESLAADYATEPTADAVSDAIAEAAAGGNSDVERAQAKQGCLDALGIEAEETETTEDGDG